LIWYLKDLVRMGWKQEKMPSIQEDVVEAGAE
jgi:hypothetical protein